METKIDIKFNLEELKDITFTAGYTKVENRLGSYGLIRIHSYDAFVEVHKGGATNRRSFKLERMPLEAELGVTYVGKELINILKTLLEDGRLYLEQKDLIDRHYTEQNRKEIEKTAVFWQEALITDVVMKIYAMLVMIRDQEVEIINL